VEESDQDRPTEVEAGNLIRWVEEGKVELEDSLVGLGPVVES